MAELLLPGLAIKRCLETPKEIVAEAFKVRLYDVDETNHLDCCENIGSKENGCGRGSSGWKNESMLSFLGLLLTSTLAL